MNKLGASRTLLLSAAVLVGALGLGCSDDGDDAADTGTTEESANDAADGSSTTATTDEAPAEPAEGDQAVAIANYAFDPEAITVQAGTTVTWTNTDGFDHTATSDDGAPAEFDTGDLGTDASGDVTFEEPGTYAYHCDIHSYMEGTVEVVE
jgi:plastocyanin